MCNLVTQTCEDFYKQTAKDKLSERKSELELKHIQEEISDCIIKTRFFYESKIEEAFKTIDGKDSFVTMHLYKLSLIEGLKASGFKVESLLFSVNLSG
jgi:hypothetical protein